MSNWVYWLVVTEVVAWVVMILGILSQKLNWLAFPSGFLLFALALLLLLIIAIIAVLLLILAFPTHHPHWWPPSVIATVVGLAPIAIIILSLGPDKLSAPRIHDISTDLNNPPTYKAVLTARSASANSLAFSEEVASQQRQAYPDIQPLLLKQSSQQVFDRALSLVQRRNWTVLRQDKTAGEIEAVEETTLFGFKDDVIIRIAEVEDGSRVDMRSASRVGQSDLGANRERINKFLQELREGGEI